MKIEYKKALAEVNLILENTEEEIKDKIPEGFKKFIKENMDEKHQIELQANNDLREQNIMQETKEILALIYRDYICSTEERKELLLEEKQKREQIEKEKQEKYNIDFDKIAENRRQKNIIDKLERETETALVRISKEKWYQKIINKVLKIFKIK